MNSGGQLLKASSELKPEVVAGRYAPRKHEVMVLEQGDEFYLHVKKCIENHPTHEVTHWDTKTFYPSSPASSDRDWAIGTFKRYLYSLAKLLGSHPLVVASIGKTDNGAWHIHYVLLVKRGQRKPKYQELKDLWWKGHKRGIIGENYVYQPDKGAVIYALRHAFYIPMDEPICPRKRRCRNGCIHKNNPNHEDLVRAALKSYGDEIPFTSLAEAASEPNAPPCINKPNTSPDKASKGGCRKVIRRRSMSVSEGRNYLLQQKEIH